METQRLVPCLFLYYSFHAAVQPTSGGVWHVFELLWCL